MKEKFILKGIAKQLMYVETGELILPNDRKFIAESETLHLRKIEGYLFNHGMFVRCPRSSCYWAVSSWWINLSSLLRTCASDETRVEAVPTPGEV
jgi:hypothetical protein